MATKIYLRYLNITLTIKTGGSEKADRHGIIHTSKSIDNGFCLHCMKVVGSSVEFPHICHAHNKQTSLKSHYYG